MAKRLVKVAKELNVGTSTIVEHLTKNGFEIDNKPTAKVTDDMYNELLKEFSHSIAIKEQADQLVIGTRPVQKKEEVEAKPVFATPPPPPPPPPAAPVVEPTPEPVAKEEPKVEEVVPEPVKEPETKVRSGLKVLGKIDLDSRNRPTKPKPKKEVPAEKPVVDTPKEAPVAKKPAAEVSKEISAPPEEVVKTDAPKVEEKIVTPVKETKKEEQPVKDSKPKATPAEKPKQKKTDIAATSGEATEDNKDVPASADADDMMRAKTPELRGLKVLGKIELPKKKAPVKKDNKAKTGTKPAGEERRRRKRKKVVTTASGNNRPSTGGNRPPGNRGGNREPSRGNRNAPARGRRPEVKEVSQKQIDEKIRQTMERLNGGGSKKKRQRMRREHREATREKQEMREMENETSNLQLTEFVTVSELASLMNVSVTQVITVCMSLGHMVSINQRLDAEIIEFVAEEFDFNVEFISAEEELEDEDEIEDDPDSLEDRAPIVTVMGHVDHGKTSLLDYIRSAKVADGEAGGITQHIGAYEVLVGDDNRKITFLDTPGHEAFTAMRARGAKVTDVAIIIISADDNIMPQTKEAISHAQAAGVPMVFAINKIDKAGAQPERIKQELASMNLLVEEWGGKYQSQDISAKNGTNIDLLLEKILLEADLLEVKANPDREASGTVIEASLEKGRGYATKILVQSGTLKIGDPMVAGSHSGKVKAMFNERGKKVKEAGPSTPVLILGLSGAPQAGEKFKIVESEPEARTIATRRAQISREQANRASKRISLDEIGRRLALGTFKELNLIVKGDVDGSIEALSDSLIKQSIDTVQVNVIHKAVGQIIESDILLASASDAIVIGFQVRPSLGARKLAEQEGVQIKTYSIIYEAIEEIRSAIEGMLEPTKEEKITGQLEVREVYKISRVGTIAGCFVQEGKVNRNSNVRLIRDGIVTYPVKEGAVGELASLKRFKDDVKEVRNGMECGVAIKNFNDIKVGDVIEAYEIVEVKQTLDKK